MPAQHIPVNTWVAHCGPYCSRRCCHLRGFLIAKRGGCCSLYRERVNRRLVDRELTIANGRPLMCEPCIEGSERGREVRTQHTLALRLAWRMNEQLKHISQGGMDFAAIYKLIEEAKDL
jgi:hypothetical protein